MTKRNSVNSDALAESLTHGPRQRERSGMTEAINPNHNMSHKNSQNFQNETSATSADQSTLIAIDRLIAKVTIIADETEREHIKHELGNLTAPTILGFLNAHAINLCWSDKDVQKCFASADVLLRDGAGMAMLCSKLGLRAGVNMNGTDFIPELLTSQAGRRVALFGSQASATAAAAAELQARGVKIVSALNGFEPLEAYVAEARTSRPDIIILGMGMPVQEGLAVQLREALEHPCLIVNGGAIIDFLAKRVRRAPKIMRSFGLEWTYRLFNEPLRLFVRYVIGNPLFLLRTQKLARARKAAGLISSNKASVIKGLVIASPGSEEGRGGMGTVTRLMAQQIRERFPDCALTLIDPRGHGSIAETPHQTARALMQLVKAARAGANVLHLQVSERSSFLRKGLLALAGRRLGMTIVLHHHGAELIPFYRNSNAWTQRYVRQIVALADVNIVLGHVWQNFLVDELGASPGKVAVLRNGVPDLGVRIVRQSSSSGRLRILSLAQLSQRKGTDEILHALAELATRGLDIEAVLAGGGDLKKYEKIANDLGVAARAIFTGWIDRSQVERQLQEADIFVLPSDNEGLPMAIIEALSLKLPVIATPVGAIQEVLQDGRDCRLVPPHDSHALANAIAELAAAPQVMQSLGDAGRKTYDAELTIDIFMQRLWTIYEQALSQRQL